MVASCHIRSNDLPLCRLPIGTAAEIAKEFEKQGLVTPTCSYLMRHNAERVVDLLRLIDPERDWRIVPGNCPES